MRSRRSFLAFSIAAICAGSVRNPSDVAASEPEQILRETGLVLRGDGVWLLPAERRLRGGINALPQLRDSIAVLQRDLAERAQRNHEVFAATEPKIATLQKTLARMSASDPKRKPLERQLAAERARATPPEQLGGRSDIRALVVQLSEQRITLTLRLLEARRVAPELIAEYARLAKESEVVQALSELGPGNRLGPLRPLEPELRRLAEFDAVVFTSHVPVWLQSGRVRLTAIVGEQQPLTLTWQEYPGHGLVLTSSAAQALDLHPSAESETRELTFAKGRKVKARRASVGSLRLGRWVMSAVPAWVLAPEGEDMGSQLDSTALDNYVARCEPAALRLTLQSREQSPKP